MYTFKALLFFKLLCVLVPCFCYKSHIFRVESGWAHLTIGGECLAPTARSQVRLWFVLGDGLSHQQDGNNLYGIYAVGFAELLRRFSERSPYQQPGARYQPDYLWSGGLKPVAIKPSEQWKRMMVSVLLGRCPKPELGLLTRSANFTRISLRCRRCGIEEELSHT